MSDASDFSSLLVRGFSPLMGLSPDCVSELRRHYELLDRWNRRLNLTSITGLEEAVLRHYCESLFLAVRLPTTPVSVLDVGSGAGFPGIPMSVLRRDCPVTLVESNQRKAVFLREATRRVSNVRVAACRAEQVEGVFDWVVSRAVKWPAVLKVARRIGAQPVGSLGPGTNALSGVAGRFPSVGLLLGQDDAADVIRQPWFNWQEPLPLPWGCRRVLVLGRAVT